MTPLSTAGTHPLFSYISRTRSPTYPDLTPCLEGFQSTTSLYPPIPILPIFPCILTHTFSNNPTNLTMAGVSSISKGFIIVRF
jgi:hypothetical protein